ncbi:MAG TPA: lipopolysaccharide biosynthesis protein [Candidatus Limisoma gallistercoris]|nr:lipopolysaccharide biosynthesis protein [Candidatus Limisoma gallistercoris]
MTDTAANNRRIAKNTVFLSIRMLLVICVTLYTSRVILNALGVEDFGIYNVVGGFVAMFAVINSSLSGASSRFLTYAIGKNDKSDIQNTFNSIVTIHFIIALIIFLLAETIGFWFVLNKLIIPPDRLTAAIWTYQSAIVSLLIMLISIPYNALIIAHEKMSAFAYISVFEAAAKLVIAFFIYISPFDKLITYSLLFVLVQITIRIIYAIYCNKKFPESHYKFYWNKNKFSQIFSFAGWTLFGNITMAGYTQGLNILLNLFFGPIVNAARGIATQVQLATITFCSNLNTAAKPQIIKSYANGDITHMHNLVLSSTKLSYFVILLISIPIFFNTDYILSLWLGEVPQHTDSFIKIMLLINASTALNIPTINALHATGNIKIFQIIEGSMLIMVVPICYLLLKYCNISPESVFITYMIIEYITQLVRVVIIYPKIGLSIDIYFTKILAPLILVTVIASILPAIISLYLAVDMHLSKFLTIILADVIYTSFIIYLLGLSPKEKKITQQYLSRLIKRK